MMVGAAAPVASEPMMVLGRSCVGRLTAAFQATRRRAPSEPLSTDFEILTPYLPVA
jgi:hypothetical protein